MDRGGVRILWRQSVSHSRRNVTPFGKLLAKIVPAFAFASTKAASVNAQDSRMLLATCRWPRQIDLQVFAVWIRVFDSFFEDNFAGLRPAADRCRGENCEKETSDC